MIVTIIGIKHALKNVKNILQNKYDSVKTFDTSNDKQILFFTTDRSYYKQWHNILIAIFLTC